MLKWYIDVTFYKIEALGKPLNYMFIYLVSYLSLLLDRNYFRSHSVEDRYIYK